MLKNKKIVIVLVIALACLIAASALLVGFLRPMRTTFYVFKDSYKAGTTITGNMLTPVQADARLIIAGGKSSADIYFVTAKNLADSVKSGDVLRTDVAKGEAFMTTHVAANGGNEVEVKLSPNKVAVTIPVSNITGITADLKSESHVNVYATISGKGTELMLENIRVLSVSKDEEGLELAGVTLELSKDQAVVVVDIVNNGMVYLALINPDGYIYDDPIDNI